MKKLHALLFLVTIFVNIHSSHVFAQAEKPSEPSLEDLKKEVQNLRFSFGTLEKAIDDIAWQQKLGDIAFIDKVTLTGPPPRVIKNPDGQGAKNPVKFKAYVFIPKDADPSKKYPLIVLPHDGIHGDLNTPSYAHVLRELVAQEYMIIAPEYRGSAGYGKRFYESIDYGGLEVEDVYASREFMLENYDMVDENRIGIMGWSHGGMITLLNIFERPKAFKVAYAGVPVSDVIARMGYKTQGYRELYSADYHIGQSAYENVEEYRKRSPAWNAHKLNTPLLIHTNTNDEDVNVLEVEHLIKSLKAEGKKFEYKIYEDMPGGHVFNRLDTKAARETRMEIYNFLAGYLKPALAFKSLKDLEKASYRF